MGSMMSSTLSASLMTSGPIPSPAMTASFGMVGRLERAASARRVRGWGKGERGERIHWHGRVEHDRAGMRDAEHVGGDVIQLSLRQTFRERRHSDWRCFRHGDALADGAQNRSE